MTSFKGLVWRFVPAGAHPLHVHYILHASGRWNRQGLFGCLYTALTAGGAQAEYEKFLAKSGKAASVDARRDLVSLNAEVEQVLDLTDATMQASYGLTAAIMLGDSAADLEACRRAADLARSSGFRGILSPCSADQGASTNLTIYVDGPPRGLSLLEGPDRSPLNY